MALRGTLKDFGIADIFQLIGHQGKSGVLTVSQKQREVKVHFWEGNVVRATTSTRREKRLLGRMLVRAEVVTEAQVDQALEIQRGSGRRIGDVLVDSGLLDRPTLVSFYRLQTHETIYQLFLWTTGNYEFNAEEVEVFDDEEPLRSENVLMEGFRQVDEWPSIRKQITSYGLKFEILVDLDSISAGGAGGGGDDFDIDAAFGDLGGDGGGGDPRLEGVGEHERRVYQLVTPDRDVQKIIDLSRLGEFETCKALSILMSNGIIRATAVSGTDTHNTLWGGINAGRSPGVGSALLRLVFVAALLAGVFVGADRLGYDASVLGGGASSGYQSQALERQLSRARIEVIRRGLEVYRARYGRYPESLETLAKAGLVSTRDLKFPWSQTYYYERVEGGYRLLRPLE